jgi:hypothetical protein
MIHKFSVNFKDYLRREAPNQLRRQLNEKELEAIHELRVTHNEKGFNIEVEDLGKEFSDFIYNSIGPDAMAIFYGGKRQ